MGGYRWRRSAGSSEPALANVTVQIYDGVTLIGTDITDANGNYYFDTTNIADGSQSLGGAQKRTSTKQNIRLELKC